MCVGPFTIATQPSGPPGASAAIPAAVRIGGRDDGLGWRRWCRSWWGGIALLAVCLSVYLPGLWTIPPVDRDESRFAQASRQMYESGDWVIPRVQDKPRLNKPPLIYWLQCGSIATFGDRPGQYAHGNIWVFRVPSVLAAIGTVLLTWRLGLRLFDPRAAWLGAAMLAVCSMVVWDAHQARADQLLLFTTVATQFTLYIVWRRNFASQRGGGEEAGRRVVGSTSPERSEGSAPRHAQRPLLTPSLFWLALSAGILTKGPITPMIALLTILALGLTTRRWRWLLDLRPFLGLIILAAAVSPWLFALTHRLGHPTSEFRNEMQQHGLSLGTDESGWAIYARIVFDETLGRSGTAKEGHWGPPGYHLVLLTVLLWPGSLLTGLALARAFRRSFPGGTGSLSASGSAFRRLLSRLRCANFHPASRFLLCWIIPSWLVFELISTKLPHYTMPLYPALALLSARAVFAANRGVLNGLRDLGTRIGFIIWWIVGVAATLGLTTLIIIAGRVDQTSSILAALRPFALPGIVIAIALFAAGRSLARGFYLRAQFQSLAAVVIWGATFLQFILPGAQRFWISSRVAATLHVPPPSGSDALWPPSIFNGSDFNEDSLVFLTRGKLRRSIFDEEGAALFRSYRGYFWLALSDGAATTTRIVEADNLEPLARIDGFNYSNGKRVNIIIFERGRPAP